MARHDVHAPIPPTNEERRMNRFIDNAFVYEWKSSAKGRTLEFSQRNPTYELFDLMMRMGDEGYVLAATLFGRKVQEKNVERAVRSHLLTRLARGLHDTHYGAGEIRETAVAHFGRFMNVLIADMAEMHVEWAEDMDAEDPAHDLHPEPIAVIRGVLLSPALDQKRCAKFWELAASSSRFPVRIFSEPCAPDDGAIFSSYHRRVIAIVFTVASDVAVERFAVHMRENAKLKMVRRWKDPPQGGVPSEGKWLTVPEPATEQERKNAFGCIAGGIERNDRRQRVSELLGVA
ncbi:MAG TPA: hypothetical protein VL500_02970 [Candidatus Eisenbacteria bacterium]|jgi:hypothetical protein|nr:hypothetical protein [Candidatus Eisenbacteria bacterium]